MVRTNVNNGKSLLNLPFLFLILFMLLFSGCNSKTTVGDVANYVTNKTGINGTIVNDVITKEPIINPPINNNVPNIDMTGSSEKSITIASWNIENFGQAKANDNRITIIADYVDNYDIVAIQEISNINELQDNGCSRNTNAYSSPNYQLITKQLNTYINNSNYKVKISPQINDERYGFIYDSSKVTLDSCWVSKDTNSGELCQESTTGLMSREPYNCKFIVNGKELILQTAHTSPSNNFNELLGLKIFYDIEKETNKNVILLGDLNYDCDYMKSGTPFNGYGIVRFDDTTVSKNVCDYDVFITKDLKDFRFSVNKGVEKSITGGISDHYLVWTELLIN